jgi:hypothetical protein
LDSYEFPPHPLRVDQRVPITRIERMCNAMIACPQHMKRRMPDVEALKPNFGWVDAKRIQSTLDNTTQYYRAANYYPFRKHFKSRFPAANVNRLLEWYATDTVVGMVPAADDGIKGHGGCTMYQLFVGLQSEFCQGYPMSAKSEFPSTLVDFIRKYGAMQGLVSDCSKEQTSIEVDDILRLYCIKDRQSEPYFQHQNPAERKIQDVKRVTNNILDRLGIPDEYWLLTVLFVCGLFNVLSNRHGEIPLEMITNQMVDISGYLSFHFWEEVFVSVDSNDHNKRKKLGKEELARWCGPAATIGDALTYWVLLNDSRMLVARSNVRSAKVPMFPNRKARPAPQSFSVVELELPTSTEGEELDDNGDVKKRLTTEKPPVVFTVQDSFPDSMEVRIPKFSPDDLLGMQFIYTKDDGAEVKATVKSKVYDRDAENHQKIKMLVDLGEEDDKVQDLIMYNKLSDMIEDQAIAQERGETVAWGFSKISGHMAVKPKHKDYKGSCFNVQVEWDSGETTWEPLNDMIKSDPITLYMYADDNDLLKMKGWKKLHRMGRNLKIMKRMINTSKARKNEIRYKFGVRIPRNVKEAHMIDAQNGDKLWAEAIQREMDQIKEFKTCHSIGLDAKVPNGYQRIPVHLVFDVKENLKRKARLVAGGHMTKPLKESVYSGVASLRSLRIVTFLAELNGLPTMAGDIGNAYLTSDTQERVCFRAGPEFGEFEGHIMIVDRALYGLRSSGARFHEKLSATLRDLGFFPSFADPDVWMRDAGDHYEYVVVYVDDLIAAMKKPEEFYDKLRGDPWNYTLKGVGTPSYHLGGDFFKDKDGTQCYGGQTYVKRLLDNYQTMFGHLPREYYAPLDKDDAPELDETELCGPDGVGKYQSMIGALQWLVSLCRFDIQHAVMSLSRFRHAPRVGHLKRIGRICGYLRKFPHGAIRFRTEIPDHESIHGDPVVHDWAHSVYGSPKEAIPENVPTPKGKAVRTSTYADANLLHDQVTGRSCSGIIHFLNQTPIDSFSKRQNQVETATYGSEFMAARQAVEQIIDLRYTLRMLGVPLDGPSWMFGDNKSVVTSSTLPHSTLSKRWNALSYHRIREAIAAGYIRYEHIPGVDNVADFLTKALVHAKARIFLDPLLFWKGDPSLCKIPALLMHKDKSQGAEQRGVTSQSARAPVTEVEGTAGVIETSHGLDVGAKERKPVVTFGNVTTIGIT